jgi:hypothetical protein
MTQCECSDKKCPIHEGEDNCPNEGTVTLERTCFAGKPRGYFCERCAEDMLESGYFAYPADDDNYDDFPEDLVGV